MEVGINLMELRDIIEKVSEMYRDERGKINDLNDELRDIGKILDDDDDVMWLGIANNLLNFQKKLATHD